MKSQFTLREEANALICCAVRNGHIEDLHSKGLPITDPEMKKLMIESTAKLAALLEMKENEPAKYWRKIKYFNKNYCYHWDKGDVQKDKAKTPMPLPTPRIDLNVPDDLSKWMPQHQRTITCNPLVTGIGRSPAMMSDEDWIRGAAEIIDKEGAEQFLVDMLAAMRA